ncbi:MAG: hypothetical protein QM664_00550 [Flavihumibacter sp.]
MIRNYLTIALRQLRMEKMYATVKIGGFALSIAACLLIALFIEHELSYDNTNPHAGRVFRILGNVRQTEMWNASPPCPRLLRGR